MGRNHELFKKLADPDGIGQSEYRVLYDFLRDLYWDPVPKDEDQAPIDVVLTELADSILAVRKQIGIPVSIRYLVWDFDQDDVIGGTIYDDLEEAQALADQVDNTIVMPVEWIDNSPDDEDEEIDDAACV